MAKRTEPIMASPPYEVGATTLRDGRTTGWACFGDPTGDPVFWFHGSPGARAQLPGDTNQLAIERRLRIIGVERPGTGDSTFIAHEKVLDFVDDVTQVADDLELEQFGAIGLSGGGPFVLGLAHEHPTRMRSGVVIGGVGPTRGPDAIISHTLLLVPAAAVLERVRQPIGSVIGAAIRTLAPWGAPFLKAFFVLEWGDRDAMGNSPQTSQQLLADLIDAARRSGVRAPIEDLILFGRHWGFELGDIKVPITFWGGTSDPIVPYVHAERQSKRVPGAKLRTIEHRGHFAGYTEPHDIFDSIREQWPIVRSSRTA